MSALPLHLLFALAAVLLGAVQCVLSRWRDLGPLTVGAGGVAVVLQASPDVLGAVGVAAVLAAFGWARGGRRGVGRPALDGLALGAAVVAGAVAAVAIRAGLDEPTVRATAAAAVGLAAVVLGGLSVQAARVGIPPPRWTGEVPVE